MKSKVTFEFDNAEAADHFASWLCEQGEQDYWNWMEYRESEESGNITGTHFDYHSGCFDEGADPESLLIPVSCGRLDSDDADD